VKGRPGILEIFALVCFPETGVFAVIIGRNVGQELEPMLYMWFDVTGAPSGKTWWSPLESRPGRTFARMDLFDIDPPYVFNLVSMQKFRVRIRQKKDTQGVPRLGNLMGLGGEKVGRCSVLADTDDQTYIELTFPKRGLYYCNVGMWNDLGKTLEPVSFATQFYLYDGEDVKTKTQQRLEFLKTVKIAPTAFDPKNPEASLKALVREFDAYPHPLEAIPESFVKHYGYAVLANSLQIDWPEVPKFDLEGVTKIMEDRTFNTVESLIEQISKFAADLDKLYATFYWAANNIVYDTEACDAGRRSSETLVDVFQTKKAVCAGYDIFFREMSERVGVRHVEVHGFGCLSKAHGWNEMSPPDASTLKSDHAAVFVQIEDTKWLCEPTWASGSRKAGTGEFSAKFDSSYFLRPFVRCLNDHFPVDTDTKAYLDFDFSYDDFLKPPKYKGYGIDLRAESHPLARFICETGLVDMQFSCLKGKADSVDAKIFHLRDNVWHALAAEKNPVPYFAVTYETKDTAPDRTRFTFSLAFEEVGLYKVGVFLGEAETANESWNCIIENKRAVKSYSLHRSMCRFDMVDLSPVNNIERVTNGRSHIHFSIGKAWTDFRVEVFEIHDRNWNHISDVTSQCMVPWAVLESDDPNRVKTSFMIHYPKNGLYRVDIRRYVLQTTSTIVSTWFEVTGAPTSVTSPVDWGSGAKPVLISRFDVEPKAQFILMKERQFEMGMRYEKKGPDDELIPVFEALERLGDKKKAQAGLLKDLVSSSLCEYRARFTIDEPGIYCTSPSLVKELEGSLRVVDSAIQFYEVKLE
jgi:hypothetical protein